MGVMLVLKYILVSGQLQNLLKHTHYISLVN